MHLGKNDIPRQESELLKQEFCLLFKALESSGKAIFIYLELLGLHSWLQSQCTRRNNGFINNFKFFWERSALFKRDGLHPTVTDVD